MRHGAKPVKRKAKMAIDIFNEESLGINALFGDKPTNERNNKRKKLDTNKKDIKRYIYIGETSRSSFERGGEHYKDLEFKRHKSHMLKHAVNHHSELDPCRVKFEMRILSSHKTAFERQRGGAHREVCWTNDNEQQT